MPRRSETAAVTFAFGEKPDLLFGRAVVALVERRRMTTDSADFLEPFLRQGIAPALAEIVCSFLSVAA
jgi:hypothetical protein